MESPREPPVELESKSLEISEEFESRRLIEEKVIAALKDENINTIGICGIGGIGKTTMARRIGEKVKRDKLFNFVVMVRAGPRPDLWRIGSEISDYVGIRVEAENLNVMAIQLRARLTTEKRILIILDDVWEILDLEKLGIPLQNKHKGSCKVMVTSRSQDVCMAMGAHKIFSVEGLTEEEARVLLREKVGKSADSSDLYLLARCVTEKCKGLPLAISVVGRMLKDKSQSWPGRVVENDMKIPALSYESASLQEMVARGSFSDEREALDVFDAEGVRVSFSNSSIEITKPDIRSWSSLPRLLNRLPPKRGQTKMKIFQELRRILDENVRGVKHLGFPNASKSETNFEELSKLGKLKLLSITDWDNLEEIEAGFISSLVRLKELDMSNTLVELNLRDSDIQVLPATIKKLINLRLLNLTNCRHLQIIEPGLISSLVRLKELYMLGSFSKWEVEKGGKRVGNASINELEFLPDLIALQIQIQDPNIIPKNSRIWSRLTMYVISTPKELKCRLQESLHLSFPAVNPDNFYWQRTAMDVHLPSLTSLVDWMCVMLRSTEYLRLAGDGSKNAVDGLIPEGFKLLKQLDIGQCSTMEYLVNRVDQVLPRNDLFPVLESLCLEDLPLFKEMFDGQLPVGLFGELRNLKLHKLPALLHVCRSPTQNVSLSNLRSVHISHCHRIRSLFSISMAQDLVQLEKIKIDYCEIMEEIFSEERQEDCKISNKIELSKLQFLELDTLPNLTGFCKSDTSIELPQLRKMCTQSLRKLRTCCPTESDLCFDGNDNNSNQFLFNEKITFGCLKKLEIAELDSATGIWCHQPNTSLFSELEVLVVVSCETLRNLFSHSIAKIFVQLKCLIVEDCVMMQEVIADDGEIGQPEISEALFPQLKRLELRRLPILESFCHMINGLELPSLEDLILYDCPGMKKFSGGSLDTPVLKFVNKDYSKYRIDGINYTVQHLFNEKNLLTHQSWPIPSQYQGTEVEEELMEEEVVKGSSHSHPELSSQASGGNGGANLQYDMNQKSFYSTSRQRTITEEVGADPPEKYCHKPVEERWVEDVSTSRFCVETKTEEGQTAEEVHKLEIRHEAKSEVSIDTILCNKRYVKDCVLFCSLFPSDYEFTKDMLVWQWMAEGLIKLGNEETVEELCVQCFDILLNFDYIVPSGYDHYLDQMKYKVGDEMNVFFQKQLLGPEFGKHLDHEQTDGAKVEHLSLAFKEIDCINFEILKQCSRLQTLIIHRCYGSKVKHLPSDLFLELKALKILNLSHTNIVELPSTVENLEALRHFDMSDTPIRWLPESLHSLSNLQTLKLDGCLSLMGLPRHTNKLINLRHLVLDVVRQLQSMPTGIGKLSKLRTLRAFLVGEEDGSRITELKNMNKLKGSIRLLNLENVMTEEEAAEACLCNKHDLKKIELQWSDLQDEKNRDEEEILKCLQPPLGIRELKIIFYSGGVLPGWISNPSFNEVVSIYLYKCRYCDSLPSLGELPSLKFLSIIEMNELLEINSLFYRKQGNEHHLAFPKLEKLKFVSMFNLEKWTGMKNKDFPLLRHLIIEYCPKFVGLPFLSHLNSLLHMEISYCPELSCLPEDGLPPTLECLMIKGCPKLKARCCNEQCEDWSKLARLGALYIDNQKVFVKW